MLVRQVVSKIVTSKGRQDVTRVTVVTALVFYFILLTYDFKNLL